MTDPDDDLEMTDAPATWENVVVGKAKEAAGHVLDDEALEDEGEEQAEVAQEVREEYDEQRENDGKHTS